MRIQKLLRTLLGLEETRVLDVNFDDAGVVVDNTDTGSVTVNSTRADVPVTVGVPPITPPGLIDIPAGSGPFVGEFDH